MIELHATKADKVYSDLASKGKYFNTGKVLIGVACEISPRTLSYSEERIQCALLRKHGPRITARTWRYMALVATASVATMVACSV
jgi:hypothetical protein